MEVKLRKTLFVGTILYTFLILYFLFFAFNRIEHQTSEYGYTFMLIPEGVPLRFPNLYDLSFSWIYSFGNIAAFIPFGILIPLLYRTRFVKFISVFVLVILVLETLQALTYLGSFDVADVMSNTLGATIGFCAYKVGFSSKISWKKIITSGLTVVVLLIGIMGISEMIDYAIEKREGPIQALHDVKEVTGSMPLTENLPSLTVAGKGIEPKMNVYSSEGELSKKYTYILGNKKDVLFYSYYGIPDKGEVEIIVDGQKIAQLNAQLNDQYYQEAEGLVDRHFEKINEITIIVSGNAKLWDVGFSEMKHWWE
ncbi:VanZ family protein [Paenibacillus sp. IHBB 10380]|uniref:VanZ family protein n=1 Tax=Paenibacillus sp. IHBB 10380 TaxID=1566358 RepID=UPI0005CFE5FA|nr:VanZ family protein [Paenibacillus sp. IHBB 10380]AJS61458.1 VanZ family protein [Paenibacillus sp. IHBB 10380]